jgi:hypothetical protein
MRHSEGILTLGKIFVSKKTFGAFFPLLGGRWGTTEGVMDLATGCVGERCTNFPFASRKACKIF